LAKRACVLFLLSPARYLRAENSYVLILKDFLFIYQSRRANSSFLKRVNEHEIDKLKNSLLIDIFSLY